MASTIPMVSRLYEPYILRMLEDGKHRKSGKRGKVEVRTFQPGERENQFRYGSTIFFKKVSNGFSIIWPGIRTHVKITRIQIRNE